MNLDSDLAHFSALVGIAVITACVVDHAPEPEASLVDELHVADVDCVAIGVEEATVCALAAPWCEDACPAVEVYGDCPEACAAELADCLEDAFEHAEECR